MPIKLFLRLKTNIKVKETPPIDISNVNIEESLYLIFDRCSA